MKSTLLIAGLVTAASPLMGMGNTVIDCRLVTSKTTECMPYSGKFIYTKSVASLTSDKNAPIITKTLPLPRKKRLKVVTVADMFDQYTELYEPLRYQGSVTKSEKFVQVPTKEENLTIVEEEKAEEIEKANELEEKALMAEKFPVYEVVSGDSLIGIAKRFGLKVSDIAEWNDIGDSANIMIGDTLIIPIAKAKFSRKMSAYKLLKERLEREEKERIAKEKKEAEKKKRLAKQLYPGKDVQDRYKIAPKLRGRSLRVTSTAYSSHVRQTDGSPFLAAWNNRLRPGMKVIAVSRDLIREYGLTNGMKVKISGLPGYYTVRDKMNSRFRRKIDIYMGIDRRRALSWGRRSVIITW